MLKCRGARRLREKAQTLECARSYYRVLSGMIPGLEGIREIGCDLSSLRRGM
jgi:hypothetical protein